MARRSLSIRSRILVLAGIAVVSFSAAVATALIYYSSIEESRRSFELKQQNIRTAQIHFKLQVQEWKNILLRGEDRGDFKKHFTRFSVEHHTVQASLKALETSAEPDLVKQIREAAAEHQTLHARYRAELADQTELEDADPHRIDRAVRGMDRSFDTRLEGLVSRISMEQDQYSQKAGLEFEAGLIAIGLVTALLVLGTSLFTSRVIGNVLKSVTAAIQTLARGNLAESVARTGGREQTAILGSLGRLRDSLVPVLGRLGQEIRGTENRAHEIKQSSDGLSKTAESLAASSEEAAAAVEELSASHDNVVHSIAVVEESSASVELSVKELTAQSAEALASVELLAGRGEAIASETMEGASRAGQVLTAMTAARENTKKIDGIMQVMYDLSERVNLLALNASIEAARAGEAGRGFAVVAEQISRMADNTAASIRDTEQLTRAIQGSVENAFSEVEIIADRFRSSAAGLGEVQNGIKTIEKGIVLQKKSTDRIAGAIQSLVSASDTVKNAAEENRRASAELSALIQTNAKESEQILGRAQHLTEIAAALSENGTQLGHAIRHFVLPDQPVSDSPQVF